MTTGFVYDAARHKRPSVLVFDIETVSNWANVTPRARKVLIDKWHAAESRKPIESRGDPKAHPIDGAGLSPWTGMVVSIAMLDPDRGAGRCLFVGGPADAPTRHGWRFEPYATERDLLVEFWATMARNPDVRLAGFRSRDFDGVYLHVRSFVHDVECTIGLVPYRYSTREHADAYDLLGFWGAGRTPSLDVVCELIGVPTPKKGLDGSQVQRAWDAGRISEIASYNADDVVATAAVVARWERTIGRVQGERRKW